MHADTLDLSFNARQETKSENNEKLSRLCLNHPTFATFGRPQDRKMLTNIVLKLFIELYKIDKKMKDISLPLITQYLL